MTPPKKTPRMHTRPRGVPRYQLASWEPKAGSSSSAPLSQVEQLQKRMYISSRECCLNVVRIIELLVERDRLHKELAECDHHLAAVVTRGIFCPWEPPYGLFPGLGANL